MEKTDLPSNKQEIEISFINYFGHVNKGDAAIILSMIDSLNEEFGEVRYTIESWHPDEEKIDAEIFDALLKSKNLNSDIGRTYQTFVETLIKSVYLGSSLVKGRPSSNTLLLNSAEKKLIQRLQHSDIILSVGGGYLLDSGGPDFLKHLYTLKIATLVDTPVMMYAQSIGPFTNPVYSRITRSILEDTEYITVRDHVSKKYLSQMGVSSPPVEVTADAAFLLTPEKPELDYGICTRSDQDFCVGLTVRDWNYPNSDRPKQRKQNYRREMSKVVDYVSSEYNSKIFFFSHTPNDVDEANRIIDLSSVNSGVQVLDPDTPPRELKYLTGEMDLFIGTRMHSTIFSMAMGTPTISIAYLPKSIDLMNRLDLDPLVLKIENTDAEEIQEMIKKVLNDSEFQEKMEVGIGQLQSLARKNTEIVRDIIENQG
ncbi:polysaccharide pyruvyl transferase family protein [Salinigranum sp. GCM10025319]|uniref:polysaccharide pyruvyl transferase family protein n=1 Tax=Salinigranum sp. GCM10025319 TaxID=3252687 RepID=UPI0036168214